VVVVLAKTLLWLGGVGGGFSDCGTENLGTTDPK